MSISSRITSIEEHIGNAYDKLDDLGIDSTGVDKNIDNIASLLDTVYEEYPKVTGTGTEIILDGTKVGKLDLDIKGNSTQETTTGSNYLDNAFTNQSSVGVTVNYNDDGSLTINGTSTSYLATFLRSNLSQVLDGTYTLICKIISGSFSGGNIRFSLGNSQMWGATDSSANRLLSVGVTPSTTNGVVDTQTVNDTLNRYAIYINNGLTFNNLKLKLYLVKGTYTISNIPEYEEYTGGIASPNPSYPQTIYSAGDDINLFDYENAIAKTGYAKNASGTEISTGSGNYTTSFTEVLPNTTYTLSTDLTSAIIRFYFYDTNKNWISRSDGYTVSSSNNAYIFTTPNNCYYIQFQNVKNYARNDKAKLVKGTNVGAYSPYGMGTISEKIVNKNLLINNKTTATNVGITFTVNDDKSITMSGTATSQSNFYLFGSYTEYVDLGLPPGNYVFSGITGGSTSSYINYLVKKDKNGNISTYAQTTEPKTFTINEGDTFRVFLRVIGGYSFGDNPVTAYLQLELSSTATTYTAHQEQTYTIPCQQPMRSIGTVRDEFIQDTNGNYFERHNLVIINLNGSYSVSNKRTNTILFLRQNTNKKNGIYPYMSNCFTNVGFSNINNDEEFISDGAGYNTRCYISINKTRLNNYSDDLTNSQLVTLLNNWLQENEAIAIYPLQTPQDLPCTEEQISILENLPKSYNEQTNIYSLDITPAYVEAKALKGE